MTSVLFSPRLYFGTLENEENRKKRKAPSPAPEASGARPDTFKKAKTEDLIPGDLKKLILAAVKDVLHPSKGSASACRTFTPDCPLYHAMKKVDELCDGLSEDEESTLRSEARKIALKEADATLKGKEKASAKQKIKLWFIY